MNKIEIRGYKNYRSYLKDLYETLKNNTSYFSYRYFSKVAGFSSPNVLKLVIDGQRNLTGDSIEKFIKALKLNKQEGHYFRNLVFLNQSTTLDEKKFYSEQIIQSHFFQKLNPLTKNKLDYYSKWYHIAIREMIGLPSFREDDEWIASQLEPNISANEAKQAIQTLLKLELIKRNDEGKLTLSDEYITTGDEIDSVLVKQFHQEMMNKAIESMTQVDRENRDISSVTINLSKEGQQEVKALIQDFRKKLLTIADQDQKPTNIYQINFQFFPLTKIKPGPLKEEDENN